MLLCGAVTSTMFIPILRFPSSRYCASHEKLLTASNALHGNCNQAVRVHARAVYSTACSRARSRHTRTNDRNDTKTRLILEQTSRDYVVGDGVPLVVEERVTAYGLDSISAVSRTAMFPAVVNALSAYERFVGAAVALGGVGCRSAAAAVCERCRE